MSSYGLFLWHIVDALILPIVYLQVAKAWVFDDKRISTDPGVHIGQPQCGSVQYSMCKFEWQELSWAEHVLALGPRIDRRHKTIFGSSKKRTDWEVHANLLLKYGSKNVSKFGKAWSLKLNY